MSSDDWNQRSYNIFFSSCAFRAQLLLHFLTNHQCKFAHIRLWRRATTQWTITRKEHLAFSEVNEPPPLITSTKVIPFDILSKKFA